MIDEKKFCEFIRKEAERINEESLDDVEVSFESSIVDDLDIDSLGLLEVCIQVNKACGADIGDQHADELHTVGDLARIAEMTAAAGSGSA